MKMLQRLSITPESSEGGSQSRYTGNQTGLWNCIEDFDFSSKCGEGH
jgi:hypothetical protein